MAGKRVAELCLKINEINGAHAAYKLLEKFDPYSLKDVLRVHATKIREMLYDFNGGER